jgi:hypothetical protein
MKRIAVLTAGLAAAAGAGYLTHPAEFVQYLGVTAQGGLRVWEGVEANPAPVVLALGTFLLTIVYYKAKGKSLRESVEVAATRVTVVPVAVKDTSEVENPVILRAKARATRTQLLTDQIGLQNRLRKLPEVVHKAEQDTCYAEQALADAERLVADKRKAHDNAVAKLEALRKEMAAGEAELAAIEAELKKLSDLV